jgi:hypothetical protein
MCRMNVVRGRETRGVKESESERSEAVRAGRAMIRTRVSSSSCVAALKGSYCQARGGSEDARLIKRKERSTRARDGRRSDVRRESALPPRESLHDTPTIAALLSDVI